MRSKIAVFVLCLCGAAQGQIIYRLTDQWVERGQRFCKYSNGTVLNVGVSLCPLSITG